MVRHNKLIVGNWKMNLDMHEASLFVHRLAEKVKTRRDVEVVLAPTVLTLQSLSLQVNHRQFKLAAQNFYWRDHGAYTGEVSASQLKGIVKYAIVGHSERRHVFNESDKDIRAKVQSAIRSNLKPILCVGETAFERSEGETQEVLHDQLIGGLANITSGELDEVTVAYEPVWAIGTGKNASPKDVVSAIRSIRNQIRHLYGSSAADNIRVLYGGSVTAHSSTDYLSLVDVDGLLVGGASLDEDEFSEIIKRAHESMKVKS